MSTEKKYISIISKSFLCYKITNIAKHEWRGPYFGLGGKSFFEKINCFSIFENLAFSFLCYKITNICKRKSFPGASRFPDFTHRSGILWGERIYENETELNKIRPVTSKVSFALDLVHL